ncbi:MAG TPA: beta-Ala-His dipeptidase, partial [Crocinitomicaceae bacterium]|nr:beta-Ala-His dipeptidase [Crocinitomicaceae bacterium]
MSLQNIEPKELWQHFSDLNAVPRPSKREERVIEFMMKFGESLGLPTIKDAIGNVIIKKPATAGMEGRQTVILQSHLDMVHQKNNDTDFDFETQGIQMYIDGDWVKAKGTTLGADNGIGVASIMAILASKDIAHPALEAMFTIDEETGMTGAIQLDPSNFSGTILLNLDTEDDDELSIGCAGGIDTNTTYSYQTTSLSNHALLSIELKGLLGGHSGMDIHKGRGNANKLANRILYHLISLFDVKLVEFDGGSLRNAIPREAVVKIAVVESDVKNVLAEIDKIASVIKEEYQTIEKALEIIVKNAGSAITSLTNDDTLKIVNTLYAVQNGVYRMSPDMENLVEASSSLARVIVKDGKFITQSLQRSSVDSSKADVANTIRSPFELMGCGV